MSEGRAGHSRAREYFEAALIALIFLKFANTFVIETFYIPSSSMEDTLLVGDRLFVNRFVYGPAPTSLEAALLPSRPVRRGDVVVFRSVEEPTIAMVKRCVGLPGDRVEIAAKRLYINGQRVEDAAYTKHIEPPPLRPQRDYFGPVVVPDGHYFCLGDNRDNSRDSRFWGPLPASYLKGRTLFIYWSYGGGTPDGSPETLGQRVRRLASTLLGFIPETRWKRTGRLIR